MLQSPISTPTGDRRGSAPNVNKITGPPLDHVHEHIQQLPVTTSHYSRLHNPHRRYLEEGMTHSKLFVIYCHWLRDTYPGELAVSPRFYRKVFTTDYNIVSAHPKTDLCSTCEKLKIDISIRKEKGRKIKKLEEELMTHKLAAKIPQEILSKTEKDAPTHLGTDTRYLCMDLQQTLPCPALRVSTAYYKCKLWMYNFCVYNMTKKTANMFLWTETDARRGADEIASWLQKWLEDENASLGGENKIKTLKIFSDNCAGQNKNVHIMLWALRLIDGQVQTQISCPDSYQRLIAKADMAKNVVTKMTQGDFFAFSSLRDKITPRQTTGISKAKKLIISSEYPEGFLIKHNYLDIFLDSVDKKVRLMPGKTAYNCTNFNLWEADLPLKYLSPLPLHSKKVSDLRDLAVFLDNPGRRWVRCLLQQQEDLGASESMWEDTDPDNPDEIDEEDIMMEYSDVPVPQGRA